MAERIVIFGGTFDPVHVGHLVVARYVAERLEAPRVTLMPASRPPHKTVAGSASQEHRLAMLRLAVAGDPLFEVSTLELDRPGPSYTFDTLTQLRQLHGPAVELVWVVGMDMLRDLPGWYRSAEVVELARVVTAARPPAPDDWPQRVERLRQRFGDARAAQLTSDVLDTPLIDISSTDIRRRVGAGHSIRYLTPPGVVEYIERQGLYRAGPWDPSGSAPPA